MENGLLYILGFSAIAIALLACILPQAPLYTEIEGTPPLAYNYIISTNNRYIWAHHRNGSLVWNLTDAYTVIESAVNDTQNAAIYITAGTYYLSHGIKLHYNIGFIGEGMTRTNLHLNNWVNESVLIYQPTSNVASFLYVQDLFIHGNGTYQSSGHGLWFNNDLDGIVMDAYINRVWVSSAKQDGFYFDTIWGCKFQDCLAEYNGADGFHLYNPTQEYMINCFSEANGDHGYYYQGGAGVHGVNLRANANADYEFYFYQLDKSVFTNLVGEGGNGTVSYWFRGATNIAISNLIEKGSSAVTLAGILFSNVSTTACNNITVTGGNIYNNIGAGAVAVNINAKQTAIHLTDCTIDGTVYNGGGTNIKINDNTGFVTENSFSGANTTATTAVLNHGLSAAATYVWCSFDTSAITGYTWSSTATQITITPSGTLPASWTAYVRAEYTP